MGFGLSDALEYIPAWRAGEETVDAVSDFKKGNVVSGFEHLGVAGLNIAPPTAPIMEGLAIANGISGGEVDDDIIKPAAKSAGLKVDPGEHLPRKSPVGEYPIAKWLKWGLVIAAAVGLLLIILLILIRF